MSKEKEVWLVSSNEEHFSSSEEYSSKEDAIRYGREELGLGEDEGFYVGIKDEYILPVPEARDFFQQLTEADCDRLGDWSEFWERGWHQESDLTQKIDQKLYEIQQLIMEHHKPDFYIVEDVEQIYANSKKGEGE